MAGQEEAGDSAAAASATERRSRDHDESAALRRLRATDARTESITRLRNSIEAVLWVSAALGTIYFGNGEADMVHVILHDRRVNRTWLHVGLGMMALNFTIFLYLYLWVACVQGIRDDWEDAVPYAVPVGTLAGLSAGFAFTVALWPVWSFLTAPMLFVLFMGFVMSFHFCPSFGWRTISAKSTSNMAGGKTL